MSLHLQCDDITQQAKLFFKFELHKFKFELLIMFQCKDNKEIK